MSAGSWLLAAAVGVLALVVLLLTVLVVRQGRALRRLSAPSTTNDAEPATSTAVTSRQPAPPAQEDAGPGSPDYVITRVGEPDPAVDRVPDAAALSVVLGEPLVKVVALAHGVRRGLSAESRNKIWFHVRREVKRSRKVRRREMREAWRQVQAERARETATPSTAQRDVA